MFLSRYKKQYRIMFWLLLIIMAIGGGMGVAYLVRYSSTNEQECARCHPEHLELWSKSKGHPASETGCYQCHSKGLEIVPKQWNIIQHIRDQVVPPEYLADDELTAQRCLDCHPEVLDLGYKVKKKVINFTHRYHIGEGLTCVDCHRMAGHEYLSGGTNRPSISECLACHRREFEGPPKNQKCLNCHDVMLAPGKSWPTH
jgi:hypothetical protein